MIESGMPVEETQPAVEPDWTGYMRKSSAVVVAILAAVTVIQFFIVRFAIDSTDSESISKFGVSGDFFGFSNALFSALAFAMIIVTLWMQRYELQQQRKEMVQTQEIMEQQTASLRRQTFENTFFGMLQLHTEIVNGVKIRGKAIHGREAIGVLLDELVTPLRSSGPNASGKKIGFSKAMDSYHKWYPRQEAEIGHYFRTLYNLMRYINEYEADGSQKTTYARLVRAQLSRSELQLLLFNGLSKLGEEKFKPLIEKYALLKHCVRSAETSELREQYDDTAFGSDGSSGNCEE